MKRLLKKFPYFCLLIASLCSLSAAQKFKMPSFKEGKNLYELIGLNQGTYESRRDAALQGIDTMDYDAIQKELATIPQTKDLIQNLRDSKKEKERLERMLSPDDLGAPIELSKEKLSPEMARQKIAEYDDFLSQAKEHIKQARYTGTFDAWAKEEIITKCKDKRKNLRKQIDGLEQELKSYPPDQISKIQKKINTLKEQLSQLAEGCSFLINPKFRAQYDSELKKVTPPSAAYENVKDAVESSMRFAGTGMRIRLNSMIGDLLSQVEIPPVATKLFNQDLALTDVRVLPKPKGEDIKYYVGFTGTTSFNTFALTINVYIIWDIFNQMRFSVGVATPDEYRLTNMFPSLQALNWMIFPKGKFVAANFDGITIEWCSFKNGFNFLAEWDIFSGPLSFFKKLQTAAPKLEGLVFEADPIRVEAVIPKNPMLSTLEAKVPMYIGLDFTKMSKLPKVFTNVINKITIGGFELKISPSAPTLEAQVGQSSSREAELFRKVQKAQQAYNTEHGGLNVSGRAAAQQARLTQLAQELQAAKKEYADAKDRTQRISKAQAAAQAKAQEEKLAASAQEPESIGIQALFEEGGAEQVSEYYQKQAGPEPIAAQTRFKEASERAKAYSSPITQAQRASARGASQQAALLGMMSTFGFTVQAQAEGILKLGTQLDPIKLVISGLVMPPGLKHPEGFISLSAQLKNMLEFGGWFAIGNAGIVIDIDVAALNALIAFGIPISGFFIKGQVDLGKPGESRASLNVGGGISVTSKNPLDALIFDVSGENIRPTDFVRFIGYQFMKSRAIRSGVQGLSAKASQLYSKLFPKSGGIPSLSLPELIFHKVWGYAALGSATIGKQAYKSGLGLQVEIELMQKKAGLKIYIGDQKDGYSLSGFGYGPPLSLSIKGRDLIKLYSAQDPSKGPYIEWNFSPKELFQVESQPSRMQTIMQRGAAAKEDIIRGAISLDGVLELPVMGLKQKTKLQWSGYTIDADFETELGGYTLLFGVQLNTIGDEVDEGAFVEKITHVRSELSKKELIDPHTVAAIYLLNAAEDNVTALNMAFLDQALMVLRQAKSKPVDTQGIMYQAIEKAQKIAGETRRAYAQRGVRGAVEAGVTGLKHIDTKGIRQQAIERAKKITGETRSAYAQRGVRGVLGAGISGLKNMIFESDVEIPYEVQAQGVDIFRRAGMKAELAFLDQQVADANKKLRDDKQFDKQVKVPTTISQKVMMAVKRPNQSLEEGKSALKEYRAAVNEQLADVRPTMGLQNWQGMLVRFGFKNVNELSKKISEQLVPYLNRLKESYVKKIAAVDAKAKRWETGDIDPTKEREAINRRETKIAQMKALCSKRPYRSQVVCQSKIKLEQTKLLKDKAILKAFIESKASKNIKRVAAIGYRKAQVGRALKAVGEKTLGAVTATVQAIATGINILNISEILGQYSYRDMVNLRLPRLVRLIGELNMMDMKIPFALHNVQFDFKHPMRSVRSISHAIFDTTHRVIQKEFLSNLPQDMQDLINENVGI